MKKSFLAFLAAGLLLVGCANKPSSSSSKSSSDPSTSSSSEPAGLEGKISLVMGEGSVEIPEYADVFLTGSFNEWATDTENALTLKQVEGTNNWAVDCELEDGTYEYQLTVGYNATSGAPATGVNWSYKSEECAAASGESGTENLSFTVENGTASLGTHTWSAVPGPVKTVKNLTVSVTFAEAVPEQVGIFMPGNLLTNWENNPTKEAMTPNEDRTVWSINVTEAIGGTYEVIFLAEYADCETYSWGHKLSGDTNYVLMVKTTWGDDYNYNLMEAEEFELWTVNAADFPVGSDVNVSLKVVADAEITLSTIYVKGSFDGWGDGIVLEASGDAGTEFVGDLGKAVAGSTVEFGILADLDWHRAVKAGGNNIKAIVGEEDTEVVVTMHEGAAAYLNAATGAEEDWTSFDEITVADATGSKRYGNLHPYPGFNGILADGEDEKTYQGSALDKIGNWSASNNIGRVMREGENVFLRGEKDPAQVDTFFNGFHVFKSLITDEGPFSVSMKVRRHDDATTDNFRYGFYYGGSWHQSDSLHEQVNAAPVGEWTTISDTYTLTGCSADAACDSMQLFFNLNNMGYLDIDDIVVARI